MFAQRNYVMQLVSIYLLLTFSANFHEKIHVALKNPSRTTLTNIKVKSAKCLGH